MTSIPSSPPVVRPRTRRTSSAASWLRLRLLALVILVVVVDVAFGRVSFGWPLSAVLAVVATVSATLNPRRARGRTLALSAAILVLGLVAPIVDANGLSVLLAVLATAAFSILLVSGSPAGALALVASSLRTWVSGPVRLLRDLVRVRRAGARCASRSPVRLLSWLGAIAFAMPFLLLLSDGDPLIARGVGALDPRHLLAMLSFGRVMWWATVTVLVWPFVHVRLARPRDGASWTARLGGGIAEVFFGDAVVVRALVLFNALFAVQTALDLAFLWSGPRVPAGWTMAEFAHRGFYSQMAAAALAGGFALVTMRAGGPAERSRLVRALLTSWTVQTLILVGSATRRLALYVDGYFLTEARLAAFAWTALVAVGLVTILLLVAGRLRFARVVDVNVVAALAMAWTWAVVDTDAIVANYNVDGVLADPSSIARLDGYHLMRLEPGALPAIDRLLERFPCRSGAKDMREWRARTITALVEREVGVRDWSLNHWRVRRVAIDLMKYHGLPGHDDSHAVNCE